MKESLNKLIEAYLVNLMSLFINQKKDNHLTTNEEFKYGRVEGSTCPFIFICFYIFISFTVLNPFLLTFIYIYIYVYVYMYVCIYIHIYIHIYL